MHLNAPRALWNLVLLAVFWEAVAMRAATGLVEAGLLTMAVAVLLGSHQLRRRARRQLIYRRDLPDS